MGAAFASSALAADLKGRPVKVAPEPEVADVPGDDIFGFTSTSDVGKAGDMGIALENDGRFGKRDGRYGVITNKLEFGRTFTDRFWAGVSLFGAYHDMRNVTVQPIDRTMYQFDGISTEFKYKLVERSVTNPFALTAAVEPRWGRIDGGSGIHAESFSAEFKLLVDAPIVPEKLFWGFNLNWAPGVQQVVGDLSQTARSSSLNVSTALTYAITPTFMIGAEAKYLASYGDYFFRSEQGRAFFLGPTVFWKINDKMSLNAVLLPQIAGKSAATPGLALDLDAFERAIFRVKFAYAF